MNDSGGNEQRQRNRQKDRIKAESEPTRRGTIKG